MWPTKTLGTRDGAGIGVGFGDGIVRFTLPAFDRFPHFDREFLGKLEHGVTREIRVMDDRQAILSGRVTVFALFLEPVQELLAGCEVCVGAHGATLSRFHAI